MRLLEPGRPCPRLPLDAVELVDLAAKFGVGEQFLEVLAGGGAEHRPRIVCEVPKDGVQGPPDLLGGATPGRAQIQRQPGNFPKSGHIVRERLIWSRACFCLISHGGLVLSSAAVVQERRVTAGYPA